MAGSSKINKWLETIVIILCIFAPMAATVLWPKLLKGNEFWQYYSVSHFSPQISWLFYPLTFLDFKQALYPWMLVLSVSALTAYFILCRFWGLRGAQRICLAVLLGAMGPFVVSIWKSYLAPILLLAVAGLFVSLKKRNFLLASLYQSLFWLQPQLILPLICFELGLGQIYTVTITVLIAVIGSLISCLMSGVGIINSWYRLFFRQIYECSGLADCTLQGQLLRFVVHPPLASQIAIVIYAVFLIAAFILGKQVKSKQLKLNVVLTVIIPLSVCLSFCLSSRDLLLLFPGILSLMLMRIDSWLKYGRALLIMCSLLILILPFYMLINCRAIESSVFNPFFWLTIVFSTGALIFERSSSGNNIGIED